MPRPAAVDGAYPVRLEENRCQPERYLACKRSQICRRSGSVGGSAAPPKIEEVRPEDVGVVGHRLQAGQPGLQAALHRIALTAPMAATDLVQAPLSLLVDAYRWHVLTLTLDWITVVQHAASKLARADGATARGVPPAGFIRYRESQAGTRWERLQPLGDLERSIDFRTSSGIEIATKRSAA